MSFPVLTPELGATGRPLLSSIAKNTLRKAEAERSDSHTDMTNTSQKPAFKVNELPTMSEDATQATPAPDRDALKLNMLRRIRPAPLKYAWSLYHYKHSESSNYDGRLTVMLENIITIKPFWESFNQFPFEQLQMKDSIHFFKRGVKPVWEDPRNVNGGSWTYRVPKALSEEFWKETLLLAVGEQFADVIQPRQSDFDFFDELANYEEGDDLCGMTLSVRFHNNLISIWNRDGDNQKTIDGIHAVMTEKLSSHLKPKDFYYKKHSEHAAFTEVVARARTADVAKEDGGKIVEAEVKPEEGDKALLKEAEGLRLEDLKE